MSDTKMARYYELLEDDPGADMLKGDVLACVPYTWDSEKLTVCFRVRDGFDPLSNMYRNQVREVPGEVEVRLRQFGPFGWEPVPPPAPDPAEDVASVINRAVAYLESLDKAATTAQDGWMGWSDPGRHAGEVYAGPMVDGYRTATVMSWSEDEEDGQVASPEDVALICTLRGTVGSLVVWLRFAVDNYEAGALRHGPLAVALDILGEVAG